MDNTTADDYSIYRWRNAILRLSEEMVSAADERADLSPLLLEALNNALENLLVYGDVADLEALEEWLSDGELAESPSPPMSAAAHTLFGYRDNKDTMTNHSSDNRRTATNRRANADRRNLPDRRIAPPGEYSPGHEDRSSNRRAAPRRAPRDRRS